MYSVSCFRNARTHFLDISLEHRIGMHPYLDRASQCSAYLHLRNLSPSLDCHRIHLQILSFTTYEYADSKCYEYVDYMCLEYADYKRHEYANS